jgi:uncharacterized membrane protein
MNSLLCMHRFVYGKWYFFSYIGLNSLVVYILLIITCTSLKKSESIVNKIKKKIRRIDPDMNQQNPMRSQESREPNTRDPERTLYAYATL